MVVNTDHRGKRLPLQLELLGMRLATQHVPKSARKAPGGLKAPLARSPAVPP